MLNDEALTRRVECAIATERSVFAEGMSARWPATKARWVPVAGGRAVFTGAGLFSNRALGMGIGCAVRERDLERVEAFYDECGLPPSVEIAATVERPFIDLLVRRGYRMVRFHNIFAQTLPASTEPCITGGAEIREVTDPAASEAWSSVLLDGFGYTDDADRDRVSRWNEMLASLPRLSAFVASVEGRPVGAASVLLVGDTAVLGGATTLPAFRRRGVQQALIRARLALAAHAGCSVAVVTADPGSTSGRNAERTGFRLILSHLALRKGA